ncbi:alanine--tRNA ligase [Chryseolinea lacunae]|uniref:Alanine--tRNA ligase n=1 Tax=Chryseolinea lacunae TaxID=2801331 RepID=A0ABS1KWE8_9BACT|nr:alanine--tRNA ligase [Chryseolinea lacunae]MBL0743791.1 alanine--tRNA ligase [Chryseolinea lacunae]
MDSGSIRRKFLDFFASKGHTIVPSAPLVLKNDPTLLFTNSGMVQFKDYFLGNAVPKSPRIADTQKCLRVSGKHNDLEEVGIDTYHHTMFEMLGNWSFGDYFKKEAIAWAWELLTVEYNLPKDRLYVSVFGGDKDDNLPFDQEAFDLWRSFVNEDRIIQGSKKDNFWEMADLGPCGPCSEIHVDLRSDAERKATPGRDLVNNDHPQVIEIWNLVFMEFERYWNPQKGGSGEMLRFDLDYKGEDKKAAREKLRSNLTLLKPLPNKNVDTGMGFERLCRAINLVSSNYDTDVFTPLINHISEHSNIPYQNATNLTNPKQNSSEKTDIAMRVIADHVRAVSFAIADGQLPSNTGAGYVIRRILRRAVRYGYSFLNFKEPFLYALMPVLAQQMKDVFTELDAQKDYVSKVIFEEETSFLRTLDKGLKRIDGMESELVNKTVSGEQAFELYDTFGFPLDLTSLIARERGFAVDEDGFKVEMSKQKNRSKADAAKETGDWILVGEDQKPEFIGYDHLESEVKVVKYRKMKQKNKELFQLVFDRTPFYAESGGQEGDTGFIENPNEKIAITDTKKENELIVHYAEKLPSNMEVEFHATVDKHKRQLSMDNHSATHLLHAALRQVLGKHVEQKGSLVNDKILRFDFSHFAAMTAEEIQKVEDIVNRKVRENITLDEKRNVPIEKAKTLGAMALFGEKYGDFVRVITFDPKFSVELCGGTHVSSTGQIGLFKIVSESSVAAGVRRIEAITAEEAERFVRESLDVLDHVKTLFKNPKDLIATTKNLLDEKHALEKKLEVYQQEQANQLKDKLALKVVKQNGYSLIIEKVSVPTADALKNIAYGLRNQFDDLLMILAADVDGKPQVSVMIGEKLAQTNTYHAGNMVKELAKEIDGGGGGQPFFATAGGKNLSGLDAVTEKARKLIK